MDHKDTEKNFKQLLDNVLFEQIEHEVFIDDRGEFDLYSTDDLIVIVDKSD